jgi:hypothetical protein
MTAQRSTGTEEETMATEADRRYEHYKEYGRRNGYTSVEQFLDLEGKPSEYTLTLADITERDLPGIDEKTKKTTLEAKTILWFRPTKPGKDPPPPMIVGVTVWETIARTFAKFFGPKVRAWYESGKRITFTAELTNKPRKGDWGIRPVGSPDIPHDHEVSFLIGAGGGKKQRITRTMRKTGADSGPPTSRSASK